MSTNALIEGSYNWTTYEGATGLENLTQSDIGVPLISVIQPKSPEVDETHPDYPKKKIEGAKAGMVIESASRQILYRRDGPPLVVIPCFYTKVWIEWRPNKGGIARINSTPEVLTRSRLTEQPGQPKRLVVVEGEGTGNEVRETAQFAVLYHTEAGWKQAMLPLSGAGLRVARAWLNKATVPINGQMRPIFARAYNVTTIVTSNAKGSWFEFEFQVAGVLSKPDVIQLAEETHNAAKAVHAAIPVGSAPTAIAIAETSSAEDESL